MKAARDGGVGDGATVRLALRVRGIVQGVGFRPFVLRLARELDLAGHVRNSRGGVEILLEGPEVAVERFRVRLRREAPPAARLERVEEVDPPTGPLPRPFEIRVSARGRDVLPVLPADLAICPDCRAEVDDPKARRAGYPFTTCTACGPRWTLVTGLPYDRARTSMRGFLLCGDCAREFEDPGDRRFHAQPLACPDCGPRVQLTGPSGKAMAAGPEALRRAAGALAAGQVLALKGLGGFQLLCDARDEATVAMLRRRKNRLSKPFAIMVPDVAGLREVAVVTEAEVALAGSAVAPAVLVDARADAVAPSVAPGTPRLAVMLPTTPLHHLLLREFGGAVVCTSGNLSEEPMAYRDEEATDRLAPFADLFLVHDRPVVRPVDDSVAWVDADGTPRPIRRARGYAPRPVTLPAPVPRVLALGALLKGTVALGIGDQAVVSQHLGDLESRESEALLRATVEDLRRFFGIDPEVVACDLHPDFVSTRVAEELADTLDVPLVRVQHHHAHAAALEAEGHEVDACLTWDGTGFGFDGGVWGGEVLRVAGASFERLASLRPFRLLGGDAAARHPRRVALALVAEACDPGDRDALAAEWFRPSESRLFFRMLESGYASPTCTSIGRLMEGLAALLDLCDENTHEARAAQALEVAATAADPGADLEAFSHDLAGAPTLELDWRPMVREVLAARREGRDPTRVARAIHATLAGFAAGVARALDLETIGASGGCFQNRHLVEQVREHLARDGRRLVLPTELPVNDGGIALGQLWVAAAALGEEEA